LNGIEIKRVKMKYLSIVIHNRLRFKGHCDYAKENREKNFLNRMAILYRHTLDILYISI